MKTLKDIPEKVVFKSVTTGDALFLRPTMVVCTVEKSFNNQKDYIPVINLKLGTLVPMNPDTPVTPIATCDHLKL